MRIKNFSNPRKAARQIGNDLSEKLLLTKKLGQKTLLLFSGGSAFKILNYVRARALGDRITVGVLDERFDPTNHSNNFWRLAQTGFYQKAKKAGCRFIDTAVKKNQTQKQLAEFFEKSLKNWKKQNPKGIVIATIGMGPDGHIAGIMPGIKDFNKLFNGPRWIASYDAGDKNPMPLRVTTTITFLSIINFGFAFICGAEKIGAFRKIKGAKNIIDLPARVLRQIKNITIYTDI